MTIQEITLAVRDTTLTPGALSEYHIQLATEYCFISDRLGELQAIKARAWNLLREKEGITSDKQADRLWDATDEGINEMVWTKQLKGIEKVLSSIKTRISILQGESKNQY